MRLPAIALSVVMLAAVAWAEDAQTPPAATGELSQPVVTSEVAPSAPKAKQKRYVNEKGEELVCRVMSGSTGTRIRNKGNLLCGTQAEWDDHNSALNKYVEDHRQNFRGNLGGGS